MQPILIVISSIVVITVIGALVGFYMGWFKFSSRAGKGSSHIAFSVNEKKIAADKNKLADKVNAM